MSRRIEAHYVNGVDSRVVISRNFSQLFAVLAAFLLVISLLFGISVNGSSAWADDDPIESGAEGYVKDDETKDAGGFTDLIERSDQMNYQEENNRNSFGFVINRFFSINYLNWVPYATKDKPKEDRICHQDDPWAGTPLYHNCDIPNLMTDFVQGIVGLVIPSGPVNATTKDAEVPFGFGIPSYIPGDGKVPVNPDERSVKYTGLELYGYSPVFTSYKGEWDQVQVATSARLMSNFGTGDRLVLGAKTIVNGVLKGSEKGLSNFNDKIKKGKLFSAVASGISGTVEGGVSAAFNTVLDSSDNNVAASWGWYRVGYGGTLYNARELSAAEKTAATEKMFKALFAPDAKKAEVPKDLQGIIQGPPKPKNAISKCEAHIQDEKTKSAKLVEIKPPDGISTGISEKDCKDQAKSQYNDEKPVWSKDGNQKAEKLADWQKNNKKIFDIANKYNLKCPINNDETKRDQTIANFYNCWEQAYDGAADAAIEQAQNSENDKWFEQKLEKNNMQKFLKDHPEHNINAPWNRFVCTDSQGKDLKDTKTNSFVFLYTVGKDKKPVKNPKCGEVRPPIQNGYFGNGYKSPYVSGDQDAPQNDTRWTALPKYSVANFLFPQTMWGDPNALANNGLKISKVAAQLSNTMIDLAFAPVLQKLGIVPKLMTMTEGFRDGIYAPLSAFVMALAGMSIVFAAGRKREYAKSFRNLVIILTSFMVGVMILAKPARVFKAVDEVPAMIETAVAGTIFHAGTGGDEKICSSTSAVGGTTKDLSDKDTGFSPSTAVRSMECEVWRTFVFDPWVSGQFGTNYYNLYAAGHAPQAPGAHALQNKNTDLVGDAEVQMGGANGTVNNWALYQLDVMTSGTSTTKDLSQRANGVPRDFYRIVDAQAGPNNASMSDSRYFDMWAGKNEGHRNSVAMLSAFSSISGLVMIVMYSFTKIEITLLSAFLLLMLPIMLLAGLHPTGGRGSLKKYTGTIVSLMFRRVMLVAMLAFAIKFMVVVGASSAPYPMIALITFTICFAFIANKKRIVDLFTVQVENAFGGIMAREIVSNPNATIANNTPLTVKNKIERTSAATRGAIGGAVSGLITGGVSGAVSNAKQMAVMESNKKVNKQRKSGLGALQRRSMANKAARNASNGYIQNELKQREYKKNKILNEINEQRKLENEFRELPDADQKKDIPEIKPTKLNKKALQKYNKLDKEIADLERRMNAVTIQDKKRKKSRNFDPKRLDVDAQSIAQQKNAIFKEIEQKRAEKARIRKQIELLNDNEATWDDYEKTLDQKKNKKGNDTQLTKFQKNVERYKFATEKMQANLDAAQQELTETAEKFKKKNKGDKNERDR